MLDDKQETIRKCAYEIWEAEGRIEGHHEDHWRRAEMEIGAAERRSLDPIARSHLAPGKPQKAITSGAHT